MVRVTDLVSGTSGRMLFASNGYRNWRRWEAVFLISAIKRQYSTENELNPSWVSVSSTSVVINNCANSAAKKNISKHAAVDS